MNFKNVKDDYGGKFAEISKKLSSRVLGRAEVNRFQTLHQKKYILYSPKSVVS
jgi:hypothetical protein